MWYIKKQLHTSGCSENFKTVDYLNTFPLVKYLFPKLNFDVGGREMGSYFLQSKEMIDQNIHSFCVALVFRLLPFLSLSNKPQSGGMCNLNK